MKNLIRLLIVATLSFVLVAPAFALNIGSNITIYDEDGYKGSGVGFEDNETEPDMDRNQGWDLEGFFFDQSNILSMVGGYDFADGKIGSGNLYTSGDIFIATEKPDYGNVDRGGDNDNLSSSNNYDYLYALDLKAHADGTLDLDSEGNGTYSVFKLEGAFNLLTAYYQQNEGSSPWQYVDGGTDMNISGSFLFDSGLDDNQTGFDGDDHYLLTGFDLSFLGHETEFYSHFTMECGNDNLMGQGTVVPEPSTFLLMGAGGGLLWLARRRKARK